MYKKLLLSLIFGISGLNSLFGQTMVSGGIYANTTWTATASPYIVTSAIVVFPNVTLTIEPGVEVRFQAAGMPQGNNIYLEIRGTLNAVGTITQPITFKADSLTNQRGVWEGIRLKVTLGATAAFDYINLSNSNHGITADDDVAGMLTLNNCKFAYNHRSLFPYSSVTMNNCEFTHNTEAIGSNVAGIANPRSIYKGCKFENNDMCFVWTDGVTTIDSCQFLNNANVIGSYMAGNIRNSRFENSTSVIGMATGLSIRNCVFENCATAIYSFANASLTNCTFTNNGLAIGLGANANVNNNVFENNTVAVKLFDNPVGLKNNKICNSTQYNIEHGTNQNFNIATNCFCNVDSATLEAKIFDGYDDITKGLLNYAIYDSTCASVQRLVTKVNLSTGMLPTGIAANFTIYPNPATDIVTLALPADNASLLNVSVNDLQGKTWKNVQYNTSDRLELNIASLPAGVYFITLTDANNGRSYGKLIKQ